MRRPLVPTGTNLLGLVKHMAGVETGYLGSIFGRPFPERLPFIDEHGEWSGPNADMWARPQETSRGLVDLYRRVWRHSDETIDTIPLDTVGEVPWWPEGRRELTLHLAIVHVIVDTQRHAGQADIVREQIDGVAGYLPGRDFPPEWDEAWWAAYRDEVERAARDAAGSA